MSGARQWCVYSHVAAGQVFYVGSGLRERSHSRAGRTARWRQHVEQVGGEYDIRVHVWADTQAEARRIEEELISAHTPQCNIRRRCPVLTRNPLSLNVGIRSPRDVKAALEKLAKAEDRTIGNLVNRICAEYLRARKLIK